MAAGGRYIIKVQGTLDDTKIREQLKALEKGTNINFGSATKDAQKTAKGMGDTAQNAKSAAKGVDEYSKNISKASAKTSKFKDLGRLAFNRVAVSLFDQAVGAAMSAVSGMVSNVFELDSALVEYRKVSDLSGKSLDNFVDKAYEMGKSVAYTGKEMIQSATLFKQSGFTDKQSLQLSKVANMYRNVADEEISAGDAASFIISQMKAFNIPAKDAMHVIDSINAVSNRFAVSSSDIATNIGKASAAMATGNVTYEQSIGLMTAMTEITRNGSTAARGNKSLYVQQCA
nr:MAG TPA: minor tail protein [Caudoviricetes sp.]